MGKEKKKNRVDLSSLPTDQNGNIDWNNSVGKTVSFFFEGEQGSIELLKYDPKNNKITVRSGNTTTSFGVSKLYYAQLEKVFKNSSKRWLYEPGEVINGLEITSQIWSDKDRAYKYTCSECGFEGTVLQTKLKSGAGCSKWRTHKKQKDKTEIYS